MKRRDLIAGAAAVAGASIIPMAPAAADELEAQINALIDEIVNALGDLLREVLRDEGEAA